MPETYRHPVSVVKGKEKNEKARWQRGRGKIGEEKMMAGYL